MLGQRSVTEIPVGRRGARGVGSCGHSVALGADPVRDTGTTRNGTANFAGTHASLVRVGSFCRRRGSDCRWCVGRAKAPTSFGGGAGRDSVACRPAAGKSFG